MRLRPRRSVLVLSILLAALLAGGDLLAGRASRSRGGGGGGGSKGTATASRGSGGGGGSVRSVSRGSARGSSDVRVASGRATWRQWGRGGGYVYRPYRPYWGGYFGAFGGPWSHWWWGQPWWGFNVGLWNTGYWGAWGAPYYAGGYYDDGRETVRVTGNLPSVIETDVRPRRSTVTLNGVDVGRARDYNGTWDTLDVPVGEHVLEFSYRGYKTLRYHVTVRPGQRLVIIEKLEKGEGLDPRSTTAHARLVSPRTPPPAPQTAERPPSEMRAEVRPAQPAPPAQTLRKGLLRLDVSPDDAAVYLDGEFLARADELARLHGALPVAVGRHTIEVVRPGYDSRTIELDVEEGDPAEVRVQLERR